MSERIRIVAKPANGQLSGLPSEIEAELQALACLNDDALLAVARSRMNTPKQRRWHVLLKKNGRGVLAEAERQELDSLTADGDRLTLCKAHAYWLLKERGHPLPELDKLRG